MTFKIGSLCSGYGGLDMGVTAAIGGETVWVSDIDKGANKILAHRYPDIPNLGNFTTCDWSTVEPVDVLTAGFPCQPVSGAGKRLGDQDERWLWDDVARAVGELRPGFVVLENVRGLLTAGTGRLFGRVLGTLAELGYDARWQGLRAAEVGAPHGRWRVFIAAYPHGGRRGQHLAHLRGLPVPHQDGQQPPMTALLPTPRATEMEESPETFIARQQRMAAAGRTKGDSGMPLNVAVSLLPTPAVNDMGEGKTVDAWDEWTVAMQAKHGNGNGHGKSLAIEAQRLLPTPVATDAAGSGNRPLDKASHPGTSLTDAMVHGRGYMGRPHDTSQWGEYDTAIRSWERLTRPAPAPTLSDGKNGADRLSPRFVEWLMGLPEGWVCDVPDLTRNEKLKALGNGVVPQQAAAALRLMLGWEVAA